MVLQKVVRKQLLLSFLILGTCLFSSAGIIVLNGLTHENVAQPGEKYRGTIQIQNSSAKEKSVRVYLRDYWFSYTGESKHDPPGTLKRSNAPWITFNPELLTLAPNETATIDYEVAVPANDSLTGTYWSVLMVEGIVPPDTTNFDQGVTIKTAIRYAVQIATNIGKSGKNDLQFFGMQLTKEGGKSVVKVGIENTGERVLKPEVSLELFDASGTSAGVVKADRRKTYPGTSVSVSLVLDVIKPGNYSGVLIADCGEDVIFGTNLSLDIE